MKTGSASLSTSSWSASISPDNGQYYSDSDAYDLDMDDVDEELGSTVTELVTFVGSEDLLRAIPVTTLLDGLGKIFANSKGTAATYQLSNRVSRIGYFVSHNWSIHRLLKFVALAFKFNMPLALGAGVSTLLLCSLLGMLGLLPTFETMEYDHRISITCRLVIVPVTLCTLFLGSSCKRCCRRRQASAFLDKACIHQVDVELQQQGIRKLGAFLRKSDRMLVLFSSVYLRKLWTVYEVASFLSMHDIGQLEVVPVILPVAYMLVILGALGFQLFHIAVRVLGLPEWVALTVNWFGSTVYIASARLWSKSKAEIREHLKTFDVAEAKCAVESDRQIVYNNIVALMKASKQVKRNATEAETLAAFNLRVREDLSMQFEKIFGRFAYSYMEYLVLSVNLFAAYHADAWSAIGEGVPLRQVIGARSTDIFWNLCGITVWNITLEVVSTWFMHLQGWKDVVFVFAANFVVVCIGNGLGYFTDYLAELATTDDVLLICLLVAQVFTTAISVYYIPRIASLHRSSKARSPPQRRLSKKSPNQQGGTEEHQFQLQSGKQKASSPPPSSGQLVVSDLDCADLQIGSGSFAPPKDVYVHLGTAEVHAI